MKVTVTIPPELEGLIQEALESGEFASVEDILADALTLWADVVTGEDDDEDMEDDAED